jgi:aspartyl-tRNA(Asn)/glutamyl-tRNA(Gln) amidotransferase subunit A
VFDAIKGKDEMDSTGVEINSKIKPQNAKQQLETQNLRIGVPKEYFVKGMDAGVEKVIKNAIKRFEEAGAKVEEISLPHTEYALSCYYIIAPSEASANLARYDGIKYGHSIVNNKTFKHFDNLLDVYLRSRGEGFGAEVRRRIILGTYVLSSGFYEAYYLRAQKVRTLIKQDFGHAFQKVDLIFTPVSPTAAFKMGEKISDPLTMYLSDIFTIAVNLAGLPAASFPCGSINNLPVGLQIIGKPFEEEKILKAGKFFEQTWTS